MATAKMLTLNTADIMGSPKQFPEYREPSIVGSPTQFPDYCEPPEFVGSPLQFPEYCEPIDAAMSSLEDSPTSSAPPTNSTAPTTPSNKALDQVVRSPGRLPSPQPVHFHLPSRNGNGNGHRVLRSATVGYIAPEFKGKKDQMIQGLSNSLCTQFNFMG
jgi:glutamate dehydrogenase